MVQNYVTKLLQHHYSNMAQMSKNDEEVTEQHINTIPLATIQNTPV